MSLLIQLTCFSLFISLQAVAPLREKIRDLEQRFVSLLFLIAQICIDCKKKKKKFAFVQFLNY